LNPRGGDCEQSREIRCLTLPHPWGTAALAASGPGLCAIVLLGGRRALRARLAALGYSSGEIVSAPGGDPVLGPVRDWLDALLVRGRYDAAPAAIDHFPGTAFQKNVWRAIAAIPPGETRTYGEIARRIGRPRAARAVGAASAANPLPPVIPCHRLVGSSGGLRGYAGGLPMKKYLLRVERPE
jgi:methylated-DNA-[protein]-cysteine S-methyltransferase